MQRTRFERALHALQHSAMTLEHLTDVMVELRDIMEMLDEGQEVPDLPGMMEDTIAGTIRFTDALRAEIAAITTAKETMQ